MNKKVMIVIFSVIIVVLVIMLIWGISWRDGWNRLPAGGWNTAGLEAGTTFEFDAGEVDELRVDLMAENVQIEPTSGTKIRVEQTAAQALDGRDRVRCGLLGRTLVVESGRRGTFSFWAMPSIGSTVRILVPEAAMLKAEIDTMSGRTEVQDLQWRDFNADSASGDIRLENTVARSASAEAISGSVRIENCEFDEMRCGATSGRGPGAGAWGGAHLDGEWIAELPRLRHQFQSRFDFRRRTGCHSGCRHRGGRKHQWQR